MSPAGRPSLPREQLVLTGLLVAGAAIVLVALCSAAGTQRLAYDFRTTYLPAAHAVRAGESPITDPSSPLIEEGKAYVYPPLLAVLLVPFTAVPENVAAFLAFIASLAALLGALAVLSVRDVRCYATVLLWAPAFNALETANVSAGLALLIAIAWRYRDTAWPLSGAVGVAVAAKLFLWPLAVWMAATGRARAAVWSGALAVALVLASWAVVGFAGLSSFPRLVEAGGSRESYSLAGIVATLGYGWTAGRALSVVVGGALLIGCALFARGGDDARSFTCAVAASLALMPIVWQHYLVLLVVPLAIARPRFSALWLLPILLWMSPRGDIPDGFALLLPVLVGSLVVTGCLIRSRAADVGLETA